MEVLPAVSVDVDRNSRTPHIAGRPALGVATPRPASEQERGSPSCHVVACRELEACLDTSVVVELHVEPFVDEACMRRIAGSDKLEYFPEFPRPLFRLRRLGVWAIQGIVGDPKLRVTYLPGAPPSSSAELRARIERRPGSTPPGELNRRRTPTCEEPFARLAPDLSHHC